MECSTASPKNSDHNDETRCHDSSRKIDSSTLLVQCPRDKSNKDEWKREVNKLSKRPNIKLRKVRSLLTAYLKHNVPTDEFSKYLTECEKKKKTTDRNVKSKVRLEVPMAEDVARQRVDRARDKILLASTLASVNTTSTLTPKAKPDSTTNSLSFAESSANENHSRYHGHNDFSSQHSSAANNKLAIRHSGIGARVVETVRFSSACIRDGSIQEKSKKSNADLIRMEGFSRKHLSCVRSSSNKLLNVYSIDDGIRPQTSTKVTANQTTTVKRFQRPCGIDSRDDRPLSRGHVPIQSCLEKAFFVTINSKESMLDLEKSKIRKPNNKVKKQRPHSAPPSDYFTFLNKNMQDHMNDILIAKGRLNLLYPKDKTKVIQCVTEELYQTDIDEKLEKLYNGSLQKRLKSLF